MRQNAENDILVVDDNRANLLAIETALEGLGRIVTASSGPDALRRLLEGDFGLILLDVQMPTMDGFETARLIRARQRSRHTPIIFVTAYGRDDADGLEAYRLGAVDFLFKPIMPEVLRAKASVFVELQRRTAEAQKQARLLQEHARREHEFELIEARRRWEEDALRQQMEIQRQAAADAAKHAEELTRTVAELERAEQELLRMNDELAQSDRRKDEFLAVLAHELRNPLTPIVNSLELLKQLLETHPDAPLRRAGQAMERQTHHLTRLVDDLLDLSRVNSGKIELRTQRLRLSDVVAQAVALSQSAIEARHHQLDMRVLDDDIVVVADAVRMSQVVSNLLNNAARYTDPGGTIQVTCERNGSFARLSVRDTGRGLPPDLLETVFDMFVQEHAGGGGLGIGLSLVRSLVHLHGGSVSAQSEGINQGSTFTVDLPLAGVSEPPCSLTVPARVPLSPALRVVVVDDNLDVRETLRDLLQGWGHEVLLAADGIQGVQLILERSPDVALIDLGLPGIDGYEVARVVRAQHRGAPVRLVAVSGYGRESDRRLALAAGFDLHLVKPAAAEALLRALALSAQPGILEAFVP